MFGNVMMASGCALSMVVHYAMGSLWRSGIDPKGPKELKTTGLYDYSRNPMYLGVAFAQLGFFFALPSVFTLLCLAIGLTALYRQTALEESHLVVSFPLEYPEYIKRVPRWL
ncbi:hypothetical protein P20652_0241 [Pseudoalteromonas sp. BSi20652]|nr:hypothetical protein P20652_0241 [Pseudoalteromonas sp. BSi20652]